MIHHPPQEIFSIPCATAMDSDHALVRENATTVSSLRSQWWDENSCRGCKLPFTFFPPGLQFNYLGNWDMFQAVLSQTVEAEPPSHQRLLWMQHVNGARDTVLLCYLKAHSHQQFKYKGGDMHIWSYITPDFCVAQRYKEPPLVSIPWIFLEVWGKILSTWVAVYSTWVDSLQFLPKCF